MPDLLTIPRLAHAPGSLAHAPGSLAAALAGHATGVLSAPAHPFDETTLSGLKWTPDTLELWLHGERLDVADVVTATPADCWRELAFVEAFPTVSHWWFGSPWTQRLRVTKIRNQADGTRYVWLQAVQEDADELLWIVPRTGTPRGMPPDYAGGAANLALALRLGLLARLALAGHVAINQWVAVTSLINASEVAALFVGDHRTELLRVNGLERLA